MHPTVGQSSDRSAAWSCRFPKSVACTIAMSGGRPGLASPAPSSPTSSPRPAPSVRQAALRPTPKLTSFRSRAGGPRTPTALRRNSLPTSPLACFGCRKSHGRVAKRVGCDCGKGQVYVRVVGVVVVDGHPLEARFQISLHVRYEGSRVCFEVETLRVLRGDDELPEARVARALPASQGGGEVDALALSTEAAPLPALALGTFPRQIRSVRGPGSAPAVPGVGGLHGASLPARVHARQERAAAASSTPESASAPAIAARPAWPWRASPPMTRGQSRGELEVVARERRHRLTSVPARLHGQHQLTVHIGQATASTSERTEGPRYQPA